VAAAAGHLAKLMSNELWQLEARFDGDYYHRSDASKEIALKSLQLIAPELVDQTLLRGLAHPKKEIRNWSMEMLAQRKSPAAVPAFKEILRRDTWELELRLAGEYYHNVDGLKVLAYQTLKAIDKPACTEALLTLANAQKPEARAWALKMLDDLDRTQQ
jgi:HEAT repeat protein